MLISSVWRELGRVYFVAGLIIGGATMALVLALLGAGLLQWWVPDDLRAPITVVLVAVVTAASPLLLRLSWAQNRRQVPQAIINRGPRVGAFQFGFEMGTGSRTYMPTTMPHVLLLILLFFVPPPTAIAVGGAFGLGRAIVPLARTYDDDADLAWTEAFDRWALRIWLGLTLAAMLSVALGPALAR